MDRLPTTPKDPTAPTVARNEAVRRSLDLADPRDLAEARRGLIAPPRSPRVASGRPGHGHDVWDLDAYAFLEAADPAVDSPASVNPSLWRQGRLNNVAGLFEVTAGVYQVRGLDVSNATFIETADGWVVIDPLTSIETARAARDLVAEHLGPRPVAAIIYTHSHLDHFGGAPGVLKESQLAPGAVPIIAPAGFLEAAVSENVLAGTAMLRRGTYMYGILLARDERGHVDTGLGKGVPAIPQSALLAPTHEVHATGEEVVIGGVRLVFHLTPGTEAPAEMNIFLPDRRALCMAENCTATLHNVYTPRGAQIRDALAWSKYIDEALELYATDSDVVFASHHWPRFGRARVHEHLAVQRDVYRFIHDQTLRLANHGLTMNEIAEELVMPAGLAAEFSVRDYYGTLSHNAKAVYQRYLGYFDAHPAHLQPHPPEAAARRYVEYMGGADAVVERARRSFAEGDYRWVAEVVGHVVFADPGHVEARELQADALEQLGYAAESGPWRDFYLTGALELRAGGTPLRGLAVSALNEGLTHAMTPEMLLDLLAVRFNADAAGPLELVVRVELTDREEGPFSLLVGRGVAVSHRARPGEVPAVTLRASHAGLVGFCGGRATLAELEPAGAIAVDGDRAGLMALESALDRFSFDFEIVLP